MSEQSAVDVIAEALDAIPTDPRPTVLVNRDRAQAALAALEAAGYTVVKLPQPEPGWWDCYEDEGDEPDHDSYGGEPGEFFVTTWRDHPGEVQISHQGEPLEPVSADEARKLAADLLAASAETERLAAAREADKR